MYAAIIFFIAKCLKKTSNLTPYLHNNVCYWQNQEILFWKSCLDLSFSRGNQNLGSMLFSWNIFGAPMLVGNRQESSQPQPANQFWFIFSLISRSKYSIFILDLSSRASTPRSEYQNSNRHWVNGLINMRSHQL